MALFFWTGSLFADKYEGATFQKMDQGKAVFEYQEKELRLPLTGGFKAFDQDGKELGREATDIGGRYRVLVKGNQVDLTTEIDKNKRERVTEIRLMKGTLATPGKAVTTVNGKDKPAATPGKKPAAETPKKPAAKDEKADDETKPAKPELKRYKNATIRIVAKNKVVLQVDDEEITVTANRSMKAYDQKGKVLKGKDQPYRVLKEGNEVTVTTQKDAKKETILTIRLIKGELEEKE
jgi:hypothetical protein